MEMEKIVEISCFLDCIEFWLICNFEIVGWKEKFWLKIWEIKKCNKNVEVRFFLVGFEPQKSQYRPIDLWVDFFKLIIKNSKNNNYV
jgi:hypothetical protein